MIPKVIHCCWLSGTPKTALAERCLASWRRQAPDWEIREWDEAAMRARFSPLPPFVEAVLRRRRWAFAADYLRFAALFAEGGVYLDMDVELVAPFKTLPAGEWVAAEVTSGGREIPNPGSGIALGKGSPIAGAMLSYYATAAFDGKTTVGEIFEGLEAARELKVLPPEVMSPIGPDGKLRLSPLSVGIHHYAMSWASPQRKFAKYLRHHGLGRSVDQLIVIKRWILNFWYNFSHGNVAERRVIP